MRYTVRLEQESDGGCVAVVPALPGCVSQGNTREEAMTNIAEAAELYVEVVWRRAIRRRAKPGGNTSRSRLRHRRPNCRLTSA